MHYGRASAKAIPLISGDGGHGSLLALLRIAIDRVILLTAAGCGQV